MTNIVSKAEDIPSETPDARHTRLLAQAYGIGKRTVPEVAQHVADVQTEIDTDREEVEAIDLDIFRLVAKRQSVTRRLGANKRRIGQASVIEDVRSNKIEKARSQTGPELGLDGDFAATLQTCLIEGSEAQQIADSVTEGVSGLAPGLVEVSLPGQLDGYMR